MAATPQRSSSLPRPRRTLIIFLAALIALYGLVALIGVTGDKGDDNPWHPKLGLDLEGGTRITFQAKAESGGVTSEKLAQARDIIDQRVNASGVSEAEVTTQGGNQIIVEIPGEKRANIVDQVGKTAQLRFRLVWAGGLSSAPKATDTTADQKVVDDLDWSKLTLDQAVAAETTGVASVPKEFQGGIAALQKVAAGFVCNPDGLEVNDVADKPLVTCNPSTGEVQILSPTIIPGTDVSSAEAVIPQQQVQWVVALELKGKSKGVFKQVTTSLSETQKPFAVVLDGAILTSPTAEVPITDGKSQISGSFTATTSKALANQLKFGALPLTFSLNGSEEIGPSLAGSQLSAGLIAGVVGLILVVGYCLLYYRGLGLVIIGSLLVAAALTYVMVLLLGKGVGFTLTLRASPVSSWRSASLPTRSSCSSNEYETRCVTASPCVWLSKPDGFVREARSWPLTRCRSWRP